MGSGYSGLMIGVTFAVDVPDTSCHWYVANADNTFGEGFDWETAPWYECRRFAGYC